MYYTSYSMHPPCINRLTGLDSSSGIGVPIKAATHTTSVSLLLVRASIVRVKSTTFPFLSKVLPGVIPRGGLLSLTAVPFTFQTIVVAVECWHVNTACCPIATTCGNGFMVKAT